MHQILHGKTVAVFDAYGTLFDAHSAVARHSAAIGPDAPRLSEMWRAKQLEHTWVLALMGRWESFWSLTEKALDFALARHPAVDRAVRPTLLDAYRDLDAYPDAASALSALRAAGLKTAILSNGDCDMLARAVASAGLGDRLDAVLSVEPARTFKTDPAAYRLVLDRFGVDASEVAFASSNRWDVAGAASFGFATAWVNRTGQPDEYPDLGPDSTLSALDGLLAPSVEGASATRSARGAP